MASDLTIPAAVWEHRVDGVPLVAGIAEAVSACPLRHYPHTDACRTAPPRDLVALRDARCECRCHGDAFYRQLHDDGVCPRCVDGRLLVDVRVECIDVHKYNERSARARLERRRKQGDELFMVEHAGDWYTGSYRTVKGLVDVVPVVGFEFGEAAVPDDCAIALVVTHAGVALYVDHGESDEWIELTPAHVEALGTIQPEQWAWTFTEVEA